MTDTGPEFDHRAASDEQLLVRFRQHRDERAFAELTRRYESMVFRVARQLLGCQHAAEDVFQATFLVLARDAKKIRNRRALASWLYGVAYRISARLAKQRATQAVPLKDEPMVNSDPLQEICDRDEQQAVHDELHRLPDKIRAPMVLRYLQGKSNLEVAEALGLSESAIEGRLKRGRNQLRIRLARHGIGFVAAVAILEKMNSQAIGSLTSLASNTVAACLATDPASQTGLISDNVTRLAEQEMLKMMTTSMSKMVFVSCLTVGALTLGWAVLPTLSGTLADEIAVGKGEVVLAESTPTPALTGTTTVRIAQSAIAPAAINERGPNSTGRFDLKNRAAWELKILAALEQPTRLEFNDTPLSEVIDFLEDLHGIQIEVDTGALEDESIDVASDTITKDISDISLRSGLRLMLDDLNLTHIIRDEVLMITSQASAEEHCDTRVYKLNLQRSTNDELIQVIVKTVAHDTWSEVGGPGQIAAFDGGLVILQSQRVHDELNEFFEQIQRLHEAE